MKYLKPALAALLLLAALLWTADLLLLRRKIARDQAYGEVSVHQRFAVHLKNKQIDYRSMKPYPETCVHSIFPHQDESPCWYLEKYSDRIDEIDGGQYHFWEQ